MGAFVKTQQTGHVRSVYFTAYKVYFNFKRVKKKIKRRKNYNDKYENKLIRYVIMSYDLEHMPKKRLKFLKNFFKILKLQAFPPCN